MLSDENDPVVTHLSHYRLGAAFALSPVLRQGMQGLCGVSPAHFLLRPWNMWMFAHQNQCRGPRSTSSLHPLPCHWLLIDRGWCPVPGLSPGGCLLVASRFMKVCCHSGVLGIGSPGQLSRLTLSVLVSCQERTSFS